MKKFLIFLVAIVVCVCVGVTTYYFLRNDEVISFEKSAVQINVDDYISTTGSGYNGLGMTVSKQSVRTEYGYRVEDLSGNDITESEVITYDEVNDVYVARTGGEYVLVITTTNAKYPEFRVSVHIGDGTEENPFYVRTPADFNSIEEKGLQLSYTLLNDITLSDGDRIEGIFTGNFDGGNNTIKGVNLTTGTRAGLFEEISGTVQNLVIENAVINGSFERAGVLSSQISGQATVSGIQIKNATITNTNANGMTGGLVGGASTGTTIALSYVGNSTKINIGQTASANGTVSAQADVTPTVGGLVGKVDQADIKASYADVTYTANETLNYSNMGGLVGEIVVAPGTSSDKSTVKGTILQSYAVVRGDENVNAFIGKVTESSAITDDNSYTYAYFIGNYAVNTESSSASLIGSYSGGDAGALASAVGESLTSVKAMPSEQSGYKFYKDVPWDNAVWNFPSSSYPTLKIGKGSSATINDISTVSRSYLAFNDEQVVDTPEDVVTFPDLLTDGANITLNNITEPINLTSETLPDSLNNFVLDGNGVTIIINNYFVNNLNNSSISNLNVIVRNVTTTGAPTYGALVNTATNCVIENVTVTYENAIDNNSITTFGGVVGASVGTDIRNCSISGLNLTSRSVSTLGGIAGTSNKLVSLANNNFVTMSSVNISTRANIGGIVGNNTGAITSNGVEVAITLPLVDAGGSSYIAGVSATNSGTISNIKISGAGITNTNITTATSLYMGGITVANNGAISNAYNYMDHVGSQTISGKIFYVSGLVVFNDSERSSVRQCIVASDIYGNYVAGVAIQQNNAQASISEVLVAGQNWTTTSQSSNFANTANTISGDTMVAGIAYAIFNGTVSDIQTNSIINAETASTKASLVVIVFPQGATLQNAVVNSRFTGNVNATYYRDTMSDDATNANGNGHFYNLYGISSFSGTMQSVVVNTTTMNSGVTLTAGNNYKQSMFYRAWDLFNWNYVTYSEEGNHNNYIREANSSEFANRATFEGSFDLISNSSNTYSYWRDINVGSKSLTFSIVTSGSSGTWVDGGSSSFGIILNFLNSAI